MAYTFKKIVALLEPYGYTLSAGNPRPPWKGYSKARMHTPIFAKKGDKQYYVTSLDRRNRKAIAKLCAVQNTIPHMANIYQVIKNLVIVEYINADPLWELEGNHRPSINVVDDVLKQFVSVLSSFSLAHGDLRPWNILYSVESKKFYIIDWGYIFLTTSPIPSKTKRHFLDRGYEAPFDNIDWKDADKLIEVLRNPRTIEKAWEMEGGVVWRPTPWE